MIKYAWMIMLVLMPQAVLAGVEQELFSAANQAFEAQDFAEAIRGYEELIALEFINGYVFYNLGNAYYHTGDIGRAVLNLERARQLLPRNPDVRANLNEVESHRTDIVDQTIQDTPATIQLLLSLHNACNLNESIVVLGVLSWLLALWLMARVLRWRFFDGVVWIWGLWSLIVLIGLQGWSVGTKIYERFYQHQAVFVQDGVEVTTGPGTGNLRAEVNSGTYTEVVREHDRYYYIRLPNGVVGFVPQTSVELLWPQQKHNERL